MADIQVFNNSKFGSVRVQEINGTPWFYAADICAALEISNPTQALKRLDDDEKMTLTLNEGHSGTRGGAQFGNVVNEPGLYALILRSRKQEAKDYRRWITHDVFPTIRRHGVYATPEKLEEFMRDPRSIANVFLQLAEERDKNKALTEENKQLAPKAKYYDVILQNPNAIPITMIAKDYGMTAPFLNKTLKDFGIQYRMRGTWVLYQKYAQHGYTHTNVYVTSSGDKKEHTCWTQKGRRFLYDLLKEHGILPEIEKVS